ncbi:MAG: hypothetical protein P8J87_18095 [Verrucomicrobiales bacterium]|nr:hypothetical protein [Verrucomicrobiales bacterium]
MFDKIKDMFGAKPAPGSQSPSSPKSNPKAKADWEQKAAQTLDPLSPPEHLCGLRDGMTPKELQDQLALLYKRHNRAASSLDPKLRKEAEIMLDAIVECRKKYLDSHS